MQDQTLVKIAYSFLSKKEKSSFNEIWTHVKKQCNISKENEEKFAGDLYTGIIGQFHWVSKKWLQSYLNEFCFKYNNRKEKLTFKNIIIKLFIKN